MAETVKCGILSLAVLLGTGNFLSTTNSAWVVDGNGTREVNITELLEANRARLAREGVLAQEVPIATCAHHDVVVPVGYAWTERCQQCSCTRTGIQCTGGPSCALPYDRNQEITCAKWADECCCLQDGCLLEDGTTVPVGGAIRRNPARPCENCTCTGGNRTRCMVKSCWPYECVDASAPLPGECCPSCPHGKSCVLPHHEWERLSVAERQSFPPIRELSPVTLRSGKLDEVRCTCEGQLVAVCTGTSRLKQGSKVIDNVL